MKRVWGVLGLLAIGALVMGQVATYQRLRLGGGGSGQLAEVTVSGELMVSTSGTAAAQATNPSVNTFPRVRIAGGTSGNLVEVDADGRLLVTGAGLETNSEGVAFVGSEGDIVEWNTTATGQDLVMQKGTTASPDTVARPIFRVDRTFDLDAGDITADGAEELAAIVGAAQNTGSGSGQPVGILGLAKYTGSNANGDAVGVYGIGYSGQHVGIGGFFFGRGQNAGNEGNGVESVTANYSGADITWDPSDGRPTFSSLWLNAYGPNRASAAVTITNSFGQQFDVGIGFTATSNGGFTGGVNSTSIYDNSTSTTSLRIANTHTTAIQVDSTAGPVVIDTSVRTPLVVGGTAVGSDLTLQTTTGVGDGTDTILFKLGNNGGTTAGTIGTASSIAGLWGLGTSPATTAKFLVYTDSTSLSASVSGQHQATGAAGSINYVGVNGLSDGAHTSGTPAMLRGVAGTVTHSGNGNTTTMAGVIGIATHAGAGTVGTLAPLYANAATCAGGTCTLVAGLYVSAQTAGTTPYQIYSVGTASSYFAGPIQVDIPTAQTIAGGDTVTANACSTLKRVTSAGAVTTNTTNTFTAPSTATAGCLMHVCNVGSNDITLDNNALFRSAGGADVVLTANDCVTVGGTASIWYQLTTLVAN